MKRVPNQKNNVLLIFLDLFIIMALNSNTFQIIIALLNNHLIVILSYLSPLFGKLCFLLFEYYDRHFSMEVDKKKCSH